MEVNRVGSIGEGVCLCGDSSGRGSSSGVNGSKDNDGSSKNRVIAPGFGEVDVKWKLDLARREHDKRVKEMSR